MRSWKWHGLQSVNRRFSQAEACATFLLGLLLAALPAAAQQQGDPILKAMQDEMQRSRALKVMSGAPPYYFEYAVHESENFSAAATLGALVHSSHVRFRLPRIQARVGDYQFDNTNFIGTDYYSGARYDVGEFPIDNDYPVLRQHLWLATDMAFKAAIEAFSLKQAALKNVTQNDQIADFNHVAPLEKVMDARVRPLDEAPWTARVRRLSALFAEYPIVNRSTVSFETGRGMMYLLNSEGTRIRVPEGSAALRVRATAQASDGMLLRDAAVSHSLDAGGMPAESELERGAREVAGNLVALVQAPVGEAYSGPVLFEGVAAAQMFAEVLGRNFALARRPVTPPGRTFPFPTSELENRTGSRVLPEWMDVADDPAQTEWRGHTLFGHYEVDMEGVAAERVSLIEKGVLKTFLLTRQPVKGFNASNGHARLPGGFGANAAGIGNLFVQASGGVPSSELRKKLIESCRERNKAYGILIRKMDFPSSASFEELRRVLTGMAQSGGGSRPVSLPILVYRVYQDGREELVRGLRLRGFNVRSLKDIVAASDETYVLDFYDNGAPFAAMGGSSFVSEASVIAPSVLIDDVELERAQEELPKPPLVPKPSLAGLSVWPATGAGETARATSAAARSAQ
jgi:TldD protein